MIKDIFPNYLMIMFELEIVLRLHLKLANVLKKKKKTLNHKLLIKINEIFGFIE